MIKTPRKKDFNLPTNGAHVWIRVVIVGLSLSGGEVRTEGEAKPGRCPIWKIQPR